MKQTITDRGFEYIDFEDSYNNNCSIQKSSLADEDTIWFGINNIEPKIMAQDAKKVGIKTEQEVGWIEYPIPKEVFINTRMHLNQEQVKELIPILQKFVETGEI